MFSESHRKQQAVHGFLPLTKLLMAQHYMVLNLISFFTGKFKNINFFQSILVAYIKTDNE